MLVMGLAGMSWQAVSAHFVSASSHQDSSSSLFQSSFLSSVMQLELKRKSPTP